MPSWGRPSGGRQGKKKKKKEWERQQQRFQEITSDSDDDQGVVLDRNFAGDELNFTGADLGSRTRKGRAYEYSDDTDDSEDPEDAFDHGETMQLAIREKEEVLVERALERIRRAKALGKPNVKLTPFEAEALQRKMAVDRATKPELNSKRSGERRRSSGSRSNIFINSMSAPTGSRRPSRNSLARFEEPGSYGSVGPPGFLVPGHDGIPMYSPIGYYAPPAGSRSDMRSESSMSLPQQNHQLIHRGQQRYFSVPEHEYRHSTSRSPSSRPRPEEQDWPPRPRSSSSTRAYPVDQRQSQAYSPYMSQKPTQYAHGRRDRSGAAEIEYPSIRRISSASRAQQSSSDPALLPQKFSGGNDRRESPSEDDDEEEDDEDDGVQVDVVPYGQGYDVNLSGGQGASRNRKGRR